MDQRQKRHLERQCRLWSSWTEASIALLSVMELNEDFTMPATYLCCNHKRLRELKHRLCSKVPQPPPLHDEVAASTSSPVDSNKVEHLDERHNLEQESRLTSADESHHYQRHHCYNYNHRHETHEAESGQRREQQRAENKWRHPTTCQYCRHRPRTRPRQVLVGNKQTSVGRSTTSRSSANCDHHRNISLLERGQTTADKNECLPRTRSAILRRLNMASGNGYNDNGKSNTKGDSWSRHGRDSMIFAELCNDGGCARCCCCWLLSGGTNKRGDGCGSHGREASLPTWLGNGVGDTDRTENRTNEPSEATTTTTVCSGKQARWSKRRRRRQRRRRRRSCGTTQEKFDGQDESLGAGYAVEVLPALTALPTGHHHHNREQYEARLWQGARPNGYCIGRVQRRRTHSSSSCLWRSSSLLTRRWRADRIDLTNDPRRFQDETDAGTLAREDTIDRMGTLSGAKNIRSPTSATKTSAGPVSCLSNRTASELAIVRILKLVLVALLIGGHLLAPANWIQTTSLVACDPSSAAATAAQEVNLVALKLTNSSHRSYNKNVGLVSSPYSLASSGERQSAQRPASSDQQQRKWSSGPDDSSLPAISDGLQTGDSNYMSNAGVACEPDRDEPSLSNNDENDEEEDDDDNDQDDYNDYGTYIIYESPSAVSGDNETPSLRSTSGSPLSANSSGSRLDETGGGSPPSSAPDQSSSSLSIQRVFFAAKPSRPTNAAGQDSSVSIQSHQLPSSLVSPMISLAHTDLVDVADPSWATKTQSSDDTAANRRYRHQTPLPVGATSYEAQADADDDDIDDRRRPPQTNDYSSRRNHDKLVSSKHSKRERGVIVAPRQRDQRQSYQSSTNDRNNINNNENNNNNNNNRLRSIEFSRWQATSEGSLSVRPSDKSSPSSSSLLLSSSLSSLDRRNEMIKSRLEPSDDTTTAGHNNIQNASSQAIEMSPGAVVERRNIITPSAGDGGGGSSATQTTKGSRIIDMQYSSGSSGGNADGPSVHLTGASRPSSLSKQGRHHQRHPGEGGHIGKPRAVLNGSTSLSSSFNIDNDNGGGHDYHHEVPVEERPSELLDSERRASGAVSNLMERQQWSVDSALATPTETLRHESGPVNNGIADENDEKDDNKLDADKDNHQRHRRQFKRQHQSGLLFVPLARPLLPSAGQPIAQANEEMAVGGDGGGGGPERWPASSTGESGQPGVRQTGRRSANDTIRALADLSGEHDRVTQFVRRSNSPASLGDAQDEANNNSDNLTDDDLERQHQLDEDDIKWLNKINSNSAIKPPFAGLSSHDAGGPVRARQGREQAGLGDGLVGNYRGETNDRPNMDERPVNLESVQSAPPTSTASTTTTIASIYSNLLDWLQFKSTPSMTTTTTNSVQGHGRDHHAPTTTNLSASNSYPTAVGGQTNQRQPGQAGFESATANELEPVAVESSGPNDVAQRERASVSNQVPRGLAQPTQPDTNSTPTTASQSLDIDLASAQRHNVHYWRLVWFIAPLGATFGNLLVILAVYRERSLQSVTNYFIVSLAFADLFVGLVVMPFGVYVLVNEVWELSDLLCDIFVATDVTCSTASILNLVAISIDRYLAIAHPIAYSASSSSTRAIFTICLVWLISCCVGAPIILGLNTSAERQSTLCVLYNSTFIFWSSLTSFYVPCIIMIGLYYRIFLAIRSRTKKVMIHQQPGGGNGLTKAAARGGSVMATAPVVPNALVAALDSANIQNNQAPSVASNVGHKKQQQQQVATVSNLQPSDKSQQSLPNRRNSSSLAERQVQTFDAAGDTVEDQPGAANSATSCLDVNEHQIAANNTTTTTTTTASKESAADVCISGGIDGEKRFVELKCDNQMVAGDSSHLGQVDEPSQTEKNNECLIITQLLKAEQNDQVQHQPNHHHDHCCHMHHHHHHHHPRSRSITEHDDCDELDDESHLSDSLCYNSRSNDDDDEDESTRASRSSLESSHYDCSLAQPHGNNQHGYDHRLKSTSTCQHANNSSSSPRRGRNSCCQMIVSPVVAGTNICSDCQLQIEPVVLKQEHRQSSTTTTTTTTNNNSNRQLTLSQLNNAPNETQLQLQCSLTTPTSISWTSTRKQSSLLSTSNYCCESHATRCGGVSGGHSLNTSASFECNSGESTRCAQCASLAALGQHNSTTTSANCNKVISNHDHAADGQDEPTVQEHQPPLGMLESARLSLKRRSLKLTRMLRGRSKDSGVNQQEDTLKNSGQTSPRLMRAQTDTSSASKVKSQAKLFVVGGQSKPVAQNGLDDEGAGSQRPATCKLVDEHDLRYTTNTTTKTSDTYGQDSNTPTDDGQTRTSSSQSTSADRRQAPSKNQIVIEQPSSDQLAPLQTVQTMANNDRFNVCMPENGGSALDHTPRRQSPFPGAIMEMTISEKSTTFTGTTTSSSGKMVTQTKASTETSLAPCQQDNGNNEAERLCDQGLLVSKLVSGVANLVTKGTSLDNNKTNEIAEVRRRPFGTSNDKQVVTFGQAPQQKQIQQHHHHRGNSRRRREKNAARRERKATKTLAIVLGIFLICWTPFFTCNIIDGICIQLSIDCRPGMSVYLVTSWLGYINSCVNPIIYTIFNMEFRRAFKKILTTRPDCSICGG